MIAPKLKFGAIKTAVRENPRRQFYYFTSTLVISEIYSM